MSAERRLLDLLAGWAEYIDQCVDGYDPPNHEDVTLQEYQAESHRVHDLYQLAGGADAMTDEAVKEFIQTHVLPLLLEGVKKS